MISFRRPLFKQSIKVFGSCHENKQIAKGLRGHESRNLLVIRNLCLVLEHVDAKLLFLLVANRTQVTNYETPIFLWFVVLSLQWEILENELSNKADGSQGLSFHKRTYM